MISSRFNKVFVCQAFLIFLFSGLVALIGCSTAQRVSPNSQIKVSQPWIFRGDFQKALYKTDMLVYGNDLSGLTMIKKTGADYRVVLMSEFGLKYFDMEFFSENDSVKVHYIINFLDRKPVIEMLENNFRLVFLIFPEKKKEKFFRDNMTKSMVKEIKYKRQKSRYTFDSSFGMVKMVYYKKRGSKLAISVNIKDHPAPDILNFNQNNLSLRLERIEQYPTR